MSLRPSLLLPLVATGLLWAQEPAGEPAPSKTLREQVDQARDRLADNRLALKPFFFTDFLSAPDDSGVRKTAWGSAELDLSAELHDRLDATAALVTNKEGTLLTVGFLDYHPYGGTIAPRGRLWVEKGFHVQAGRFDIPFGNDWQFFASKDSTTIARPLTTALIMDGGYNDAGLRVLGNDGTLNFNAFLVRGFSRGHLAGGRLGFTPFGNPFSLKGAREPKTLEIGLSYLFDAGRGGRKSGWAAASDAEIRVDAWTLRGEYIARVQDPGDGSERTRSEGWHLTQEFAPGGPWPVFFLRYERAWIQGPPEEPSPGPATLGSAGFSLTLGGLLQVKVEAQRAAGPHPALPGERHRLLFQAVLVL
ncbi:MAG: hypothetical protein HY823_14205 [Acidobacteria bacterium]|nr:hypothetical protein [Acidobacteriota bacterium]